MKAERHKAVANPEGSRSAYGSRGLVGRGRKGGDDPEGTG